jgi:hypothetical protein
MDHLPSLVSLKLAKIAKLPPKPVLATGLDRGAINHKWLDVFCNLKNGLAAQQQRG